MSEIKCVTCAAVYFPTYKFWQRLVCCCSVWTESVKIILCFCSVKVFSLMSFGPFFKVDYNLLQSQSVLGCVTEGTSSPCWCTCTSTGHCWRPQHYRLTQIRNRKRQSVAQSWQNWWACVCLLKRGVSREDARQGWEVRSLSFSFFVFCFWWRVERWSWAVVYPRDLPPSPALGNKTQLFLWGAQWRGRRLWMWAMCQGCCCCCWLKKKRKTKNRTSESC